jgi:hypothetical protein
MTRYHFNIRNGDGFIPDEEGRELAGPDVARSEAVTGARSLIADGILQGRLDLSGSIEITDAKGELLFVVPFADTITDVAGV